MKYEYNDIKKLQESINKNNLTIYGGIFSSHKNWIIKKLIDVLKETNNVIILNFNISNVRRFYTYQENIDYIASLLKPNVMNVIVIWEFTNCENWSNIINDIFKHNRTKVLAITSSDFSGYLSFVKNNKFCLNYNEIIYFPPSLRTFAEQDDRTLIELYIENGSTAWAQNYNKDNIVLLSELNISRLYSIFLIMTKVRNHFHLEIFFSFLVKNIDKKLTLDFIKNGLCENKYLNMKNIKTFWKYINLLQVLYILLPINSYCITRKQERFNSRFVCIDHMIFKYFLENQNLVFLTARNILITEFIKKGLKILLLEENNNEIGFFGITSKNKCLLFKYEKDNSLYTKLINQKHIEENDIYLIDKNIKKNELINLLKHLSKNNKIM